ncbi:DNA damage-regulated autophagy modulator protein 1-like [Actinia tenebrosa]|uniref:DNA damage-regulated autophagy modulator protein 1-like n=1 Tax=Actinia tenebrosa TaxID=6105 RepID=A0A6P8IQM5_ACTTE|nr:DNA damage-regulated autophagy modulator protein 1-like [Actinia tenebrosa]
MPNSSLVSGRKMGLPDLGLGWLCILFVVLTISSISCSYSVALIHGHIYPFFPAISDTGALSPEKYIFRELNNLAAFLFITNAYVRYMQYQLVAEQCREEHSKLENLNKFTFGIGILAGISMTLVANFEIQREISFHNIGAFTGFVSALIYCWLQSLMSYKLRDHGVINSTAVCHSRTMLSAIMTFAFIIFFIFQTIAHIEWDNRRPDSPYLAKLKWGPKDPGYICHVTSNIAEWTMTAAFFMFVTTFLSEFQQIRITSDISSTEYWE